MGASPCQGITYLSKEEALRHVFPKSTLIQKETKVLLTKDQEIFQKKYDFNVKEKFWDIYVAKSIETSGAVGESYQTDGYALILNEIGKELPITFIVGIDPKGKVIAVDIMTFRESHGGGVKNKKFLSQYEKKTSQAPLMVGKDIVAISGATLSSRAITVGVKKGLAIVDYFFLHKK